MRTHLRVSVELPSLHTDTTRHVDLLDPALDTEQLFALVNAMDVQDARKMLMTLILLVRDPHVKFHP